ncbi:uracil nucleotide cysteinyl leukotriene receptor [Pelobates cultripes]|uniref:Uracil nucleotide cysteinyl leukotriene receptor n=1 Tax=Pelobates cultripes TaxID=61616 RepID=A0AAD1RAQ5_PELCU|nr:uracil nucleotide cysteinyl leukotriene receptor [Pelobates cultripes]
MSDSDGVILLNSSSFSWVDPCVHETWLENILLSVCYILGLLVGGLGNVLALSLFIRDRQPRSPSDIFLLHLALSDLFLLLSLPTRLYYHLSGNNWPFGSMPCRLSGFVFYLNMYASLYFLAGISIDRYLAIVHPLNSIKFRRPLHAHVICILLWAIVAFATAPLLLSRKQTMTENGCRLLYRETPSLRALTSLSAAFAIPFLGTVTCYGLILKRLRQGGDRKPKERAVKMVLLVLTIFLICFVPYHLSRALYHVLMPGGEDSAAISPCNLRQGLALANRFTSCLSTLNAALDPLVYFFAVKKFRQTLLQLPCRRQEAGERKNRQENQTEDSSLSAKTEV